MPRALDISTTAAEDGRLPKSVSRRIRDHLALFAGREVRIRISSPKRSTAANRYYWGVIIAEVQRAMAEAGMPASSEAIHEHFKRRYLPVRVVEVLGETHVIAGSSADLDSTDFHDYIESIRTDEDVIALGCVFPEPDEDFKSFKISEPA